MILADGESHESEGRVVNGLMVARELQDAGDDVTVLFDGAGTQAAATFGRPEHEHHDLVDGVRDSIAGACKYCAGAFGATEGVEAAEIELLDEYKGHPSIKKLIDAGYEIVSF